MISHDYITHDEIRQRAYGLWERLNRPDGRDVEHWLAAENELQREREALAEGASTEPPSN
jgi:hypothetical protein